MKFRKFILTAIVVSLFLFPSSAMAQDTATKTLTLTVASTLVITTSSLPVADPLIAYSVTLTATGGVAPYIWTATGLPTWATLSTAGVLSGTPPVIDQNTSSTLVVTVTDSAVPANVRSIRVVTNQ
jgi:hypothetical protein